MVRLTLRGLVHHRLRLAATALAVVLGVGFVAGTYVLTDTIHASLQTLLGQSGQGIDVVVQARSAVASGSTGLASGPPMSDAVLARVRAVPGVAGADGQVIGSAELIGRNGKPVGSSLAPSLGISVGTVPQLRVLTLRSGRFPTGPDQMVVDQATAQAQHYRLGARVPVAGAQPLRTFTVVGIVGYGTADNLAGATLAGFDLATAQAVTGIPGKVSSVLVAGAPGVSNQVLAARIAGVLGNGYKVQTGSQYQQQSTNSLTKGFGFFTTALLIFAGVALFVGAFLVVNTFSIIVAQRSRELALLRCLGAYRRQLLTMVLAESGVVGLVASAVGLLLGIGLAVGLRALLGGLGVQLPSTTTQILPRTVVVSLVAGTAVTMAAATFPAIRASRAAPLAALRDDAEGGSAGVEPSIRNRVVLGTVLAIVGVVAVGRGLFGHGGSRAQQSGIGVAAVLLAVAAFGPVLARPLAGLIGRPAARLFHVPGRLARQNAMRHPRRTSSTAAALMIGLSLVTLVAVFSQTIKASLASAIGNGLTADAIVSPADVAASGFTTEVASTLAGDHRFTAVTGLAQGAATLVGGRSPGTRSAGTRSAGTRSAGTRSVRTHVLGVDVPAYLRDVRLQVRSGSVAALATATDTVAVADTFATAHHLAVGKVITLTFPTSGTRPLRVVAVYHDPSSVSGSLLVSNAAFVVAYPVVRTDEAVLLRWAPGVSPSAGLRALSSDLRPYPQVKGQDRAGYLSSQQSEIDQLVALVTALLALAIVIAFAGIVNTLALSIMERTREIGLLRIVGMTRRQVRAMVRIESVIIALLGSLLGMVIGLGFGWVLVRSLRSKGLTQFAVPWGLLAGVLAVAAVAGVLAAVLPARRAARIDVLAAIAVE